MNAFSTCFIIEQVVSGLLFYD